MKIEQLSNFQMGEIIYIKENLTNIIAVKPIEYRLTTTRTELVFMRSDNKEIDIKYLSNKFYRTIDDAVNDKPIPTLEIEWDIIIKQLLNDGYEIKGLALILYYPYGTTLNTTSIRLENTDVIKYHWYDINNVEIHFNFYEHWEMNKVGYYKSKKEYYQKNLFQNE